MQSSMHGFGVRNVYVCKVYVLRGFKRWQTPEKRGPGWQATYFSTEDGHAGALKSFQVDASKLYAYKFIHCREPGPLKLCRP